MSSRSKRSDLTLPQLGLARVGAARERRRRACARPTVVAASYRRRDWATRRLLAVADLIALTLGLAAMVATSGSHSVGRDLLWGLVLLPAWLILLKAYGTYDRDRKRISHTGVDDIPSLFHAVMLGSLLTWSLFQVLDRGHLGLWDVAVFGIVTFLAMQILRIAGRRTVRAIFGNERVLLVGDGPLVRTLGRKVVSHPEYGLEPVGLLSAREGTGDELGLPVVGDLCTVDLAAVVAVQRVERLVFTHEGIDDAAIVDALRRARELGIKVNVLPKLFEAMGSSMEVDDVEGITLLGIHPPVLSFFSRSLKRGMDIVGAAAVGIVALPFLALIAIGIKLDSSGPVFFTQWRVGRGGRRFRLVKLRTMCVGAQQQREPLLRESKDADWLHLEHDPRITRFGRYLRLASLDELPQLWNVLRGEMSLVGPRPLIEDEDRQVTGWARGRIDLTPGLTGLWQVLGRTNIPFDEMVKLDYMYVTNWSLWTDLRLILRTVPVLLSRRGAN